jgi:hypothetical protein
MPSERSPLLQVQAEPNLSSDPESPPNSLADEGKLQDSRNVVTVILLLLVGV